MLFLLLRFLPYIVPLIFFGSAEAVFYYGSWWPYLFALVLVASLLYFILLKYKNRDKSIFFLSVYALIYAATGLVYLLILENPIVINSFIIFWALLYWLFLEAVFHDFYETKKTYAFNLQNIIPYGNILVIFFLTAALINFSLFLSLSWWQLLLILAAAYFCLVYLAYLRQIAKRTEILLYSGVVTLILVEILGGLTLWPSSFYVIAILVTLCYYLLMSLSLLSLKNSLTKKALIQYLTFGGCIIIAALITATWL